MPFTHEIRQGTRVLSPAGRLDHENCDLFQAGLQPHLDASGKDKRPIVFDLSRMDYVSSAGLRCFMLAARHAKAQGYAIAVAAMQPVVAEIFQISRFNLLFRVFPGVAEALAAVTND